MRYREYELPIQYYHITILNGHPECSHVCRDLIPGSKISFSLPDQIEYPFNPVSNHMIQSIEDVAEELIENDESYFHFTGESQDDYKYCEFFSEHYKEIFCGKYPEWIVYDIDALCDASGFCISFVNTKTLNDEHPVSCWLVNKHVHGYFQVNVSHPNRPAEKYLLGRSFVAELVGQTWRKYEFCNDYEGEEDKAKNRYTLTATIEEYALM